jgi:Tol biopolymer transport system component
MVGRVLQNFEIVEKVGQGGMGVVYRAHDLTLKRFVAIKFLQPGAADEEHQRRFQREARAASSLNHPHILTVHETGTFEGQPYLVTEFVDGYTLREWLAATRPSLQQKAELLTGIADALAAAHESGILHRDIKPDNILVGRSGHAKLVDFGLAKLSDPDPNQTSTLAGATGSGVLLGTLMYMSPEQAAARPVDARSDIFSFGVVLYETITGRRPFAGDSTIDVLHNIIHADAPPLDAPPELRMIVEKALEKDPADRYQSMRELVVDLKRFTRTRSGQNLQPAEPAARGAGKRWLGRIAAAALVITTVLLAVVLLRGPEDWVNPLDGARIERVTDFEAVQGDAVISRDGKFVVFLSDHGGGVDGWVTRVGSGELVNITKNRFAGLLVPGIRSVGFTQDGSHAWFRVEQDAAGNVITEGTSLVSLTGGVSRRLLETGVEPDWSPDGTKLVYHDPGPGDAMFIADGNGSNPRPLFAEQPGAHCHFLTWSRDGQYVYFVRGLPLERTDIWRVRASGGSPERITHHDSHVAHPALLDDHRILYIATARDGSGPWLYETDLKSRVTRRVSIGVEQYLSISAAADGSRLAALVANPTSELWTIPISDTIATESAATKVPVGSPRTTGPRFGPGYILYLSSRGGAHGLSKYADGAATELWNPAGGGLTGPAAISPDAKNICFAVRSPAGSGLYVMTAHGTDARRLESAKALDIRGAPSWSPDGRFIVVTAYEGERRKLFRIPIDGGTPVALVTGLPTNPVWSPDGQVIIYRQRQGPSFMIKAIKPDATAVPSPDFRIGVTAFDGYRFVPGTNRLIVLQGDVPKQNFWVIDLTTGVRRQLTDLRSGLRIQSFDVSPDGTKILFDRWRERSEVIVVERAARANGASQ